MAGLHQQVQSFDGLLNSNGSTDNISAQPVVQTTNSSLFHGADFLGYDDGASDAMNGESLTVIADGNVLKDMSGNVVGTLNDDGTYTLVNNFTAMQVTPDEEALLENFENQMASDNTQTEQKTSGNSLVMDTPIQKEPTISAAQLTADSLLTAVPIQTEAKALIALDPTANFLADAPVQTGIKMSTDLAAADAAATDEPMVQNYRTTPCTLQTNSPAANIKAVANIDNPEGAVASNDSMDSGNKRSLPPLKRRPSPSLIPRSPEYTDSSPVQKFQTKGSDSTEPITIKTPVTKQEEVDLEIKTETKLAPLGSSKNPIRIIQQGNSYTSTQQLTQEQLAQIMQVVQQQQALKEAQEAGGSKVIYNSQTQTKIVYKVVNPASGGTKVTVSTQETPEFMQKTSKKRGRPRSMVNYDDEEKFDAPPLSVREKTVRMKKRPKTRSGRVSKPPKHMIEDYKHIHLLDWQEDYDDDDGGYSDYKGESDEEEKLRKRRKKEEFIEEKEASTKRTFSCASCGKVYHAKRWLDTHYEQFPKHRPESERVKVRKNEEARENGHVGSPESLVSPQNKKGGWNRNSKRYKLKEMMAKCPDEVLLDVMLPKLCSMVTVWEFLLMKIEDEHPDTDVTFPMIYKEFENLRLKVKQAFDENMKENLLRRVDEHAGGDTSKKRQLKITNEESAMALGTEPGSFRVVDKGPAKPDYMFLTPELTPGLEKEPKKTNRKVAVVPKEDIVHKKTPKQADDVTLKKPKDQKSNKKATTVVEKKESKIEIVSVPKDKVPGPKYKSVSQVRKELEAKKLESTQSPNAKPDEQMISIVNTGNMNASSIKEEKKIDITITDSISGDMKEKANGTKISVSFTDTWPPSEEKSDTKDNILKIPATSAKTSPKATEDMSNAKDRVLNLPVPQPGSIVMTSSLDRAPRDEVEDEHKKARDMATSVEVSEKAKNAMGVVSDMSDLDVWAGPSKQQEQSDATERSVVTVEKITPIRSTASSAVRTQPKTVTIAKSSHDDKMVSILGLNALSTDTPMAPQTILAGSDTAGVVPEEPTATQAPLDSTEALGQEDEHVQMVIQHPDGSYQIIEGEEAARLMQQATDTGATFVQESSEDTQLLEHSTADTQQTMEPTEEATPQHDASQILEQPFQGNTQEADQAMEEQQQMLQQPFEGTDNMEQPGEASADTIQHQQQMSQQSTQGPGEVQQPGQYATQMGDVPSEETPQATEDAYQMIPQSYEGAPQMSEQAVDGTQQMTPEPLQQHGDADQLLAQQNIDASELMDTQPGDASEMVRQPCSAEAGEMLQQPDNTEMTEQPPEQMAAQATDQALAQPAAGGEETQNIDPNTQTLIFQTDDGLILIRQPDGNFQVQSTTGAQINMDTVRALISSLQFT